MTKDPAVAPDEGGLDPDVPEQMGAAALAVLAALAERLRELKWHPDHWHFSHSSERRSSEDGVLIEYGISVDLVVCPERECGAPDDGGVPSWSRWAHDNPLRILEGTDIRSDEEMAAAAIQAVIRKAHIAKRREDGEGCKVDFRVFLPDGTSADVEATMHTDGERRRLTRARHTGRAPGLKDNWMVLAMDKRLLGDYAGDNAFPVKEVLQTVAAVLARVENGDFGLVDDARIGELCEEEIRKSWRWATNDVLESEPPLAVTILHREPSKRSRGEVDLTAATSVFHFSRVTALSGLVSAVQQCVDRKLEKDQWGDSPNAKWLVVVLDEGEAATQLKGVTEFDDTLLDFSGLALSGLDEVWVVAFEDGRLTVLRFMGSCDQWHRYLDLNVEAWSPLGSVSVVAAEHGKRTET